MILVCRSSRTLYSNLVVPILAYLILRLPFISVSYLLALETSSPHNPTKLHKHENRRHGSRGQVPRRRPNPAEMARSSKSKAPARTANTTATTTCPNTRAAHAPTPPTTSTILPRLWPLGTPSSARGPAEPFAIRPRPTARNLHHPTIDSDPRQSSQCC